MIKAPIILLVYINVVVIEQFSQGIAGILNKPLLEGCGVLELGVAFEGFAVKRLNSILSIDFEDHVVKELNIFFVHVVPFLLIIYHRFEKGQLNNSHSFKPHTAIRCILLHLYERFTLIGLNSHFRFTVVIYSRTVYNVQENPRQASSSLLSNNC